MILIYDGWKDYNVYSQNLCQRLFQLCRGAEKTFCLGTVVWLDESLTTPIGSPLIEKKHFEWITKSTNWPSGMMLRRLEQLANKTLTNSLHEFIKILYINRARFLTPTFNETKQFVNTILQNATQDKLPIFLHYQIIRRCLSGSTYEEAKRNRLIASNLDFEPTTLTPPTLKSLSQLLYESVSTTVPHIEQQSTPKNHENLITLYLEIDRVNNTPLLHRKIRSPGDGFYRISVKHFPTFAQQFQCSAFDFLINYVLNNKPLYKEDHIQFFNLPSRDMWGASMPIILMDDQYSLRNYIITDTTTLLQTWTLRSQHTNECCWNEIFLPGKTITTLVLDVDLKTNSSLSSENENNYKQLLNSTLIQLMGSVLKQFIKRTPLSHELGPIVIYKRSDEKKLSLRIVWRLPLQFCRWDVIGIKYIINLMITILSQQHLEQKTGPLTQYIIKINNIPYMQDPITYNWFTTHKTNKPTPPFTITDISNKHTYNAIDQIDLETHINRAINKFGIHAILCGIDPAPYAYRKSIRLPLCDKPNMGRFNFFSLCENTDCLLTNKQLIHEPTFSLSGWAVDEKWTFIENVNITFPIAPNTPQTTTNTITDEDCKTIIHRISLTFNISEIITINNTIFRPKSLSNNICFCYIHNKIHKKAIPYFIGIEPDIIYAKCFVYSETPTIRMLWSEEQKKYLPATNTR